MNIAATPKGQPVYKTEAELGAAMLKYERANGHECRLPRVGESTPANTCDITLSILGVMDGEMMPAHIAARVSEKLGRRVASTTITDRLRGTLKDKVVCRHVAAKKKLWSKI